MIDKEKKLNHLLSYLSASSGLLFLYFKYFHEGEIEWSVVSHPLQPYTLGFHIIISAFLLISLGILWKGHVVVKLKIKERKKRKTGIFLISLVVPMVLSGFLIQLVSGPEIHKAIIYSHIGISSLWFLAYVWHQLKK